MRATHGTSSLQGVVTVVAVVVVVVGQNTSYHHKQPLPINPRDKTSHTSNSTKISSSSKMDSNSGSTGRGRNSNTDNSSSVRRVGVEVWSSFSGWSVRVDGCHHHLTCHTSPPLVSKGFTLPPEDARPHPPTLDEGVTLTVLNQRKSSLIFHRVFPLGQYWAHWADLEWHLSRVAPGRIVVMTVAVSGTVGLRDVARRLDQLGSLFALHLTPMAHWTWVFVKGGRTISETAIIQGYAPHHAHLILPLSHLTTPPTSFSKNQELRQQRWQYCEAHGAMGGLCDEDTPDPLPVPPPPPVAQQWALDGVPVVVTAGNRHQYLYHTLTTLLTTPGAQHNNILVALGDAPQPTTQLLRLLNITFTKLVVHGKDNNKLFRYYRSVFQYVARTFPDAPAVIILDEDVQVSPDFFSYMSQTLWLLYHDPTLYCINGYGGTKDLSHDETKILRGDNQVSWGYAISLDFVREALQLWPSPRPGRTFIYDYWLYSNIAGTRECVFPDVSRSRHFGIGVNTVPWVKENIFQLNPLVEKSGVLLADVERVQLSVWSRDLAANIRDATPILHNPCDKTFLPDPRQPSTYVFYLNMTRKADDSPNIDDYFCVAHCLGAWSFSPMGLHKGVKTLRPSTHATLHLVGVPYSPYSYLRPPHIPVWSMATLTPPQKEVLNDRIKNRTPVTMANTNLTIEQVMNTLSGCDVSVLSGALCW
ncbi:protein O-linked-mannose beta-1,2-N-acetylglucosaminyltransferase 1-like [Homarus americanus]|uniref:protein O-linked-mannose beta-1,2-N-acetylglucosaminyltransferase 1-like n=1 Tax=Homarus americanus TaxID=6706 RepID=UPI001C482764|nr:protein O-linked-mannose beta-1,2-N-acetylglucosaminyltransferase 1-like [Homarus americanus]